MNNDQMMIAAMDARVKRRESRRSFLQGAGGVAAAAVGATMLGACGGSDNDDDDTSVDPGNPPLPPPAPPAAVTDADILNFALNLEYLEAEFYSFAVNGTGLPASLKSGTGIQGQTTPGRRVNFTDRVVAEYAREIAADEIAHVRFLRTALGAAAVAAPDMDVGFSASSPFNAFTAAARASGLITATAVFDPYANDEAFLLGAFVFEDVGVTAYKGASPLLTSKTFLEAAAGILAVEAYHAGLIRTILTRKGFNDAGVANAVANTTTGISNARDGLDGATDLDQGIVGTVDVSNIAPTDANALAFSRSAGQVLNIVYLNRNAVGQGGFFPTGVNGPLRTAAAN